MQIAFTDQEGIVAFNGLSIAQGTGYCGGSLPTGKHLECELVVEVCVAKGQDR